MQVVKGKIESVKKLPRRDGQGYFYRVLFDGNNYICFDPKIEDYEGLELEMETTEVVKDGEVVRYLRFLKEKKSEGKSEVVNQRNTEERWWGSEIQKRVNLMSYAECCVRDIAVAILNRIPEDKITEDMINDLYKSVQERIAKFYDMMLEKVNSEPRKTESVEEPKNINSERNKLIRALEVRGYTIADLLAFLPKYAPGKERLVDLTIDEIGRLYEVVKNLPPKC